MYKDCLPSTPARKHAKKRSKKTSPESRSLPQPRNQNIFGQLHYQVYWAPQPHEIARHGPLSSHRSQKLCLCFSEALSRIYSRSFISSRIPDAWRLAQISPIFKKVIRCLSDNYRPISLTSVPWKLIERIARDSMMKHLFNINPIVSEQHGFVLRKSVVTNLLESFDSIYIGI